MGNNLLFFKLSGLEDWQGSILASEGTGPRWNPPAKRT